MYNIKLKNNPSSALILMRYFTIINGFYLITVCSNGALTVVIP